MTTSQFKVMALQQEYKIMKNLSEIARLLTKTMSMSDADKFGGVNYGYGQMINISLSKNQEQFFVNYFFLFTRSNNLRKFRAIKK